MQSIKDNGNMINKLFYEKKIKDILKIFSQAIEKKDQINVNLFNRLLIQMEKNNELYNLQNIYFNAIKNNCIKINEQTLTIIIRSKLSQNKLIEGFELLKTLNQNEIKKRTIMLFYDYYFEQDDLLALYKYYKLNFINNKFQLDNEDYNKIINLALKKNNKIILIDIIKSILGKKVVINLNKKKLSWDFQITKLSNLNHSCLNCENEIKKLDLNAEEKKILINNFEDVYIMNDEKSLKNFKKYKNFINNNENIKIIIDAGNILFYGERKITFNSFLKLQLIIKDCIIKNYKKEEILTIIHCRHQKYLSKNFNVKIYKKILELFKYIEDNSLLYQTPNHMNDDWFILYPAMIIDKSLIISNDLLKDHKFSIAHQNNCNELFEKWSENVKISFDFQNKSYTSQDLIFDYPLSYSERIQLNNDHYHIPCLNNKWLCIKKD